MAWRKPSDGFIINILAGSVIPGLDVQRVAEGFPNSLNEAR
jgi:hypothetical protein